MSEEQRAELLLSLNCLVDDAKDLQSLIAYAEVDDLMDDAVTIEQAIKRLLSRVKAAPAKS